MQIDKTRNYEVHRAFMGEEARDAGEQMARLLLSPELLAKFLESRDRAGTGGPMVMGGQVSSIPGSQIEQIYAKAQTEGARPCRIEENGQVLMGDFVFVPVPD
jgi:hypothetical protein